MLKVIYTTKFVKDVKRIKKRGKDVNKLIDTVRLLSEETVLPERLHDHALTGDFIGMRECHIEPDWLLVYKIDHDVLVLTTIRTGTHSDVFG